jgi:3-phosphoshikimate 1-carboxyvinyltransferase
MIKKIKSSENLQGEITIPADKSISHRAAIFSSIAKGESIIRNFSTGKDCLSTIRLLKQAGVKIDFIDETTLKIYGGELKPSQSPFNCGNSGTTMRLVSGILAGQKFNSSLIGDISLSKRPMDRIIKPLSLMGADIFATDGHAPLFIKGENLRGITYESPIASAQVKSCILLAGLNATGETSVIEPYISRNHSELMLQYMGANINTTEDENNKYTVSIKKSNLAAQNIDIVGDISSAAFFIVAGLIVKGSDFIIKNVGMNPTRTGIIDIVIKMGGQIEIVNERTVSGENCADIKIHYSNTLKGCEISGKDIPRLIDEIPIIAVLATQADGETIIKNAEDLRNKEADRISCLVKELQKIGADIQETTDGFIIRGRTQLKGGAELETYHDHRLAMSFYVAGLVCQEEISIKGFEWTNISFPEFESLFSNLSL